MDIVILTDSSCDLPLSYIKENNIPYLSLTCHLSYGDFKDDFGNTLDYKKFYNSLRQGEMPKTSQINTYTFEKIFRKYVHEGKSIIYIGMSSAISGCINSALIAKNQIIEEIPNADINIVDSKSASIGEGILVYKAIEMLKLGASKNDVLYWLETNILKMNHWFMVDNLMHLKRGGRLSSTSATIGTLLNIKPIIFINKKGELINPYNIRGRKKAIKSLVKAFEDNFTNIENEVIGITHGDCIEDALHLKELLIKEYKIKNVLMNYVGPVLASHTGENMLSICFLGKERIF
ncbi:DegV family protein [Clostridium rectalis]|uniref:DegV family protein n=1 Tax=Clostridium rectalis TaxID=2040295 RepID=UPI000F632500|nr:DegV family protein [Clostridium rectalis]